MRPRSMTRKKREVKGQTFGKYEEKEQGEGDCIYHIEYKILLKTMDRVNLVKLIFSA